MAYVNMTVDGQTKKTSQLNLVGADGTTKTALLQAILEASDVQTGSDLEGTKHWTVKNSAPNGAKEEIISLSELDGLPSNPCIFVTMNSDFYNAETTEDSPKVFTGAWNNVFKVYIPVFGALDTLLNKWVGASYNANIGSTKVFPNNWMCLEARSPYTTNGTFDGSFGFCASTANVVNDGDNIHLKSILTNVAGAGANIEFIAIPMQIGELA